MAKQNCWNCSRMIEDDAIYCPYCTIYHNSTPQKIGPYKPVQGLGQGQFGRVFKAVNPAFGDRNMEVAIKLFHAPLPNTGEVMRELQLMARLPPDNENLVKVYQDSNVHYIVMEYVPGQTLYKSVREHYYDTVNQFENILRGLCNGLVGLHSNMMIHRDFKPGNVLVTNDWTAKIADMGLATIVTLGAGARSKVGSREISSPEIFALKTDDEYDNKVDLWALGVIIYFIWTGHYPFGTDIEGDPDQRDPGEIERAVVSLNYKRPEILNSHIPSRIIELIDKLLVEPEKRIGSAQTILNWISDYPYRPEIKPSQYPLIDYQRQLVSIYAAKNAGKHHTVLVSRTISYMGFLANASLISNEAEKLEIFGEYLPRVFAWMCAIVDAAGWRINDIIIFKYPNQCPYCNSNPCTQNHPTKNVVINERLLSIALKKPNFMSSDEWTFADFANMFRSIYGEINSKQRLSDLVLRFYSEASELSYIAFKATSARRRPQTAMLFIQLSDFFAWFFAVHNALPRDFSFEEHFWRDFQKCPWCGTLPCSCPDVSTNLELSNWRLSRATLEALDIAGEPC